MNIIEPVQIDARERKLWQNPRQLQNHLDLTGQPYSVRESRYMTCLITGNTEYMFPNMKEGFNAKQLWIFGSVKKSALKFLANNPGFDCPPEYPTNRINMDFDDNNGVLTGTDITGAYWHIAYQMGIISKQLFEKCDGPEWKSIRLAALAVLGRAKVYRHFEDGILKGRMTYPENVPLKRVYKAIRYTCFQHMNTLAGLLKDNFDCYKTDCIYYRDSVENRKIVYDYLDLYGFKYVQLIYKKPVSLEPVED